MQTQIIDLEKAKTEAIREVKHCANHLQIALFELDSKLEKIPKICVSLSDIADRLQIIENCLKINGFLEEKIMEEEINVKRVE